MSCEQIQKQHTSLSYSALLEHSSVRGNLISWYPTPENARVLLVSEPCGIIEDLLREKAGDGGLTVWTEEQAEAEQRIWAERMQQREDEVPSDDRYDMILQIGIFDKGMLPVEEAWRTRLQFYHTLLKEDGTLLLAVPNRLGLKYFAGCQDEVYDAYFAGPEGYSADRRYQTLSKKEYETALRQAGFGRIFYYYPYPDYLFPNVIFSERYLPGEGELNDNIRNFNKDRYVLFDEMRVYNSLLKEGLFEEFANSYLIVGKIRDVCEKETVIYSKFSMERDVRFQIRTDILQRENGERVVRKHPLTAAAEQHIKKMEENYRRLQKTAEGTNLVFCPTVCVKDSAEFPWAEGEVLQHRLQRFLEKGQRQEAEQLILQYVERMGKLSFEELADVDLIFSNILVDGDTWNIIDHEWSFAAAIPQKWILYRAMFYLSVQLPGYEMTELARLLALAGITEKEAEQFGNWEVQFQEYLRGDTVPIGHMVDLLGNQVIPFAGNCAEEKKEASRRMNLLEKDARKLYYHIDRVEKKDGKWIVCGWACAKTKQKAVIPVHVTIFNGNGDMPGRTVQRSMRPDVAEVLKADTDFPYWGFDLSWSAGEEQCYTLRLSAGKLQQEVALQPSPLENGERN